MFENMTKTETAKIIAMHFSEDYGTFMVKKSYKDGEHVVYAGRVRFTEKVMALLEDNILEFLLTLRRYTEQLEKKLTKYLGLSFCSLVNFSSLSTNLAAVMVFTSPLPSERVGKTSLSGRLPVERAA